METQNVTLSLPKKLLQEIKALAARRGTSMSALLSAMIADALHQEDQYVYTCERSLARLEKSFDLGSRGLGSWTREDLHER